MGKGMGRGDPGSQAVKQWSGSGACPWVKLPGRTWGHWNDESGVGAYKYLYVLVRIPYSVPCPRSSVDEADNT
jgi:hypothetical protein